MTADALSEQKWSGTHPMVATLKALNTYREPKMSEHGAKAASSTLVENCNGRGLQKRSEGL